MNEISDEIGWLKARYEDKREIYNEHGFDDVKLKHLIKLLKRKLEYVTKHFENDNSFEWVGGFNFIVTGVKPLDVAK